MSDQQDASLVGVLSAMADAIAKVHLETVANATMDIAFEERMQRLDEASTAVIEMLNELNAYVDGGGR